MTISLYNYELPDETHNLYDVTICNEVIHTLVTHTPSMVDSWISGVKRTHRDKGHRLIVGLDVEWLPNLNRFTENPPATLQLCVGGRCLIFQLLYSRTIPQSLVEFLRNVDYEFMGVEIEKDADKLSRFYDLKVVNVVDLRDLAVEKLGREELGRAGLTTLAREVLGKEIEKDKIISWGRWDNEELTDNQVKYACVDAFLSFEIGRSLCETRTSFSDETGRSLISSLIGLGIGGSGSGSGRGSGSFHQSSSLTDETGRSLSLTGETVGRSSLLGKSLSLIGIGLGVGIGASLLMAKANHTDADEDDDAHA